jgi:hypothetical protein
VSEPVLSPAEQEEQERLTRQVGRALLGVAPSEWTEIRAEYRSAGRHIEVDVLVTGPDGTTHPMRPPMEVVDGLGRMRQIMYRPGRGTWLSATYILEPPSSFTVDFEPDLEPRWRRLPPPIGFQDELRFFPRADDHIPDWFRQRAGLPPTGAPPGPGSFPPGAPPAPGAPPPGTPGAFPPGMGAPPPGSSPPPGMPAPYPGPPATPPGGLPNHAPNTPPGGLPYPPPPAGPQPGPFPFGQPAGPAPFGGPPPGTPPAGTPSPLPPGQPDAGPGSTPRPPGWPPPPDAT